MRAAVSTRYGPPDVVRVREVDRPAVGDDQLLVRVRATTVNRTDCGIRAARPFIVRLFTGLRRPRATVLGTEFAGEVEQIGRRVTAFAPGDCVFGYCEGQFGAHAQHLAIAADAPVAAMPPNVTFDQAAAATEGAHYALSFIRAAGVRRGQHVLVNGATGAIGSAAVQILKALGARVTAVCGTEHQALVAELGADRVIDYRTTDFTRDGARYDVVLDAVGKSTFWRCRRILAPRGVYLSSDLGPWAQNPLLALATRCSWGRRVLFPIPSADQATIRHFAGLMASGAFRPLIDRRYPLDRIVEAYRYVETGEKVGNVVISLD